MSEIEKASLTEVLSHMASGILTQEFFQKFVHYMRSRPDVMELMDVDVYHHFMQLSLSEDAEEHDYIELNRESIDPGDIVVANSNYYQKLENSVIHWLEQNTKNLEVVLIAGLKGLSCALIADQTRSERVISLLEFVTPDLPNLPACRMVSAFLRSRPEGYFNDISINHGQTSELNKVLGDRLLREVKGNSVMVGNVFSIDIGI